ncbi:nitroreductase family protein [Paenibacillus sp. HWE-109]|uniref:nitroreductase family protein n=1 Tax=Paenibacillus sp. HWE-109 TaxID=1306526 RepID=UPI001EDCEFF4|nr:nitroreductase family protein [Paenibacillus sp. HWE-109]UKS29686.1 nitroreductase family protein [Paenibacillus sp. HWE-109]
MNTALTTNDFNQIVAGRHSIKKYDPTVKISRDEMTEILRKATLAPSSVNMQPWRFLIIESPKAKAILAPLSRFNQRQVETSSAVIAIFGDLNSINNAEAIYGKAVELGFMPMEVKEKQLAAISKYYEQMTPEVNRETVLIDSGLVSMQLMLVARAHGYDTNAIGGYEKDKIAEAFGLDPERYVPVMLISIGKAVDNGYPSVRLPIDQVTTWK